MQRQVGLQGADHFNIKWQVVTRQNKNPQKLFLLCCCLPPMVSGLPYMEKKTCWHLWEYRKKKIFVIISIYCNKIQHIQRKVQSLLEWTFSAQQRLNYLLVCEKLISENIVFHCVYGDVWKLWLCTAGGSTGYNVWSIECTLPCFLLQSRYQKQYIPQNITRRKEPDCYGYRKIFLLLQSTRIKCCIEPKKSRNGSQWYL